MKLLAIDAGNTHTVSGLFEGKKLKKVWRVESNPKGLKNLSRKLPQGIEGVIVSSVVPPLRKKLVQMIRKCRALSAIFVTPNLKMPIRIRTKNPKEVGADRIVNAVAAYTKYEGQVARGELFGHRLSGTKSFPKRQDPTSKQPLLVIDFGTATTFDVVTSRGDYIGGAIVPGIKIAAEALAEKCAKLPRVTILRPKKLIGRSTIQAIRSGVFYGYASLVEGMIVRFKKELGPRLKIIATGGLAPLIGREVLGIDEVDPNLTLKGLRLLYELNR